MAVTYKEAFDLELIILESRLDKQDVYRLELAKFIKKNGVKDLPSEHLKNVPKDLRELSKPVWRQQKGVRNTVLNAAKEGAKNRMMWQKLDLKFVNNKDVLALSWTEFAAKYDFNDYSPRDGKLETRRDKVMKLYFNYTRNEEKKKQEPAVNE